MSRLDRESLYLDAFEVVFAGLDVRPWRSSPGFDVYPPHDPSEYRVIVWLDRDAWRADVEYRSAFSWDPVRSVRVSSVAELNAVLTETLRAGGDA